MSQILKHCHGGLMLKSTDWKYQTTLLSYAARFFFFFSARPVQRKVDYDVSAI